MEATKILSFEEFAEEMRKEMQKRFPEIKFELHYVLKNNGTERLGITTKNLKVSPMMYLEEEYKDYAENGKDMDEIKDKIHRTFYREFKEKNEEINMEWYTDYEKVKEKLRIGALNAERNKEMLANRICDVKNDIAFYAYVECDLKERGRGTISVTEEHRKKWKVSREKILLDALHNMECEAGAQFLTMERILFQHLFKDGDSSYDKSRHGRPDITDEESLMYILTNRNRSLGAGMAYSLDILDTIASNIGDGFYMLPSSIHEWIILRNNGAENPTELKDIIMMANKESVPPEDFLSDSLYQYSATDGIRLVKGGNVLE